MAAERTTRKAGGDFYLQSPGSVGGGGGAGEVLPRGSGLGGGNKTDTSKSLHMGNLPGRGTGVSCEFKATRNNSGTEPVKVTKVLRSTFLPTANP